MSGYEDLVVWQKSIDLVTLIYAATANFPKHEIYGLCSQIRRAAVSIPSNIAEGSSRHSVKDFTRFLLIAKGSLAELETQIFISRNLGYVSVDSANALKEKTAEAGRMISGMITKFRQAD